MHVIRETEERTVTTPAAVMVRLAAPSQGSTEVSSWRVRMKAGIDSPVHIIDREQVWMPVSGVFEFTVDGENAKVGAGEALVVPAGVTRQFHVSDDAGEAIVCMPAGGQASVPGSDAKQLLPWAQ
ncbi:MAG TPA: cupin domain-containing protein [Streptosporangiaceae bacterium]|jgi:quercetin dioxygenase-like cupin family protein